MPRPGNDFIVLHRPLNLSGKCNGLGSYLAQRAAGKSNNADPARDRAAVRLLGREHAMAIQVSGCTVLGFYLLIALGAQSPFGRAYEGIIGRPLPFSFQGLLLASILYSFPFAVRPFIAAFAGVERRLVEASWSLGISRLGTFFEVICPLAWAGILTGLVLAFAHTLGEFGVVLMVGGNIPGVTRTVSVAIYDNVQAVNYAQAAMTSLVLLGSSFVALSVTYLLQRKGGVL